MYELEIPLPDDTISKKLYNRFNKIAFNRLCQEFNLDKNPDFRWKGGKNHGLGSILIKINGKWRKPPIESNLINWPNHTPIFHDEHGIGGQVGKIINEAHNGKQYEWFTPDAGIGLTKPGLGRLNRSVEGFIYCIVGTEVNVRSSIVGDSGGAQETQQEMIGLFEDAIKEENIAKSVQNYQQVIQEAKLRSNLAIAPGIWSMPSNLVINAESVTGYNNYLLRANDSMTFGVNDLVNEQTKQVGLKHNLGT